MKPVVNALFVLLVGTAACLAAPAGKSGSSDLGPAALVNRIDGIVWSPERRPVPDVWVELQNEMYMSLSRLRTTASGRFSFTVQNPGNYYVKVLSSGTNYLDAVEPVEIVNVTVRSSDSQYMDIYLKYDKRKINTGENQITDAVFVQEIPDEARKLYRAGVKDLENKQDKGFDELDQALKIFPDYFDALNKAGREYVQRKEFQKSLPYLIRAIDVNQRSYSSFYALAYACFKLNHTPEAVEAARGAVILQPNSVSAQHLYGTLLRLNGNYDLAEKALLQAKKLSKDTPVADIHMQLALLYNKLGRNGEAADELETYLKINPDAADKVRIRELIVKLRNEKKS